jgi:DNA-directed RNA polymerase beta subunit
MIYTTISYGASRHRLLIKDQDYSFTRVFNYVRVVSGLKSEEEHDEEVEAIQNNEATEKVISAVEKNIEPEHKAKITYAVKQYLKKDPETIEKINNNEVDDDEKHTIASGAVLSRVSGDYGRSFKLSNMIPQRKIQVAFKSIAKKYSDEILKPRQPTALTNDIAVLATNPTKRTDNKSPIHIYEKRQLDFERNLKNDLTNSFKVLETQDIPVRLVSLEIKDKAQSAGEIMKSDLVTVKIELTDDFKNKHKLEIELPKIDPNTGSFRVNGKRKCLVNQIVQNPITFPKPGESRFESSYSIFRIYSKKMRSEKYLEAFMMYKIPLMILLSFSFGFDRTVKLYGLKYKIIDTKPTKTEKYAYKISTDKYIVFEGVETELQKQLVNSFNKGDVYKYDTKYEFGTQKYFEEIIIKLTGRINSTFHISSNLKNIVDPVVKQILFNKQLPTELELIMKYMSEKVIAGYHITRNDLSNQRIRNSEIMVYLAQKQILSAYTSYKEQVLAGNTEAKIDLHPTKVLSDFLMTELVVNMEYANPMEEMSTMTRVSPVGKKVGGIPDTDAITLEARNLHPTYFGNIDPLDTPEGGNIGVVQQLTIDAVISSSRGLFGTKDITNKEGAGMLSTTTCMSPFIECTDGARIIMAANQAKQMLPLKNPQPPPVQTGFESIFTGVLSGDFIKRAPIDGKIIDITLDAIVIQGAKKEVVDITPVHLNSGSGKNTLSVFKPLVKIGNTVKKGNVIAEGACMDQGMISLGRPLLVALMPYNGYNFEDGMVINERLVTQDKLTSLHGIVEEVVVSAKDRVLQIAEIGQQTEKGVPLIRKTVGEIEELIGYDDDETTDISAGQFIKKSPGGKIVDIEVFSNVGDDFPGLTELIKRTNRKRGRKNEKFKIKGETINGVLIRFRIEQELKIKLGDKLCNRFGHKGIVSLLEKDELMPRLPNGERVDMVLSPVYIINRMNISQLYEMYCGFISKELATRIISMKDQKKILDLIESVYSVLDTSVNNMVTKEIMGNLRRLNDKYFKMFIDQIKKNEFYPLIVPPFKGPKYTQIGKALKLLGLKESYHLTLPGLNTKTMNAVPVGYMYIAKLEHMADNKIYGRSTGPVTTKTSQPTSGKSRDGGQRTGELDTYSYISYDAKYVLAEMLGPLSDDYLTKEEIVAEIVQTGGAGYKESKIAPARDLLNSYFISLILDRG